MTKKSYRVRNWQEYNKALTQRGSLTLWIDETIADKWYEKTTDKRPRGRQLTYSAFAMETCLRLRLLFHLALRQGHGFVASVFALMQLHLPVPSASQQCRRQKTLALTLGHQVKGPLHVVVDATGLKMYGEGEWKVRQHGYSKHRMWRKLHIGIDVASQQVVMMALTDNGIGENKLLRPLLNQYTKGYTTIGGDKGYDAYDSHEEVKRRGATSAIMIQRQSKIRQRASKDKPPLVRDEIIRQMRKLGRKGWKKAVNYHQRSLVETAIFRYKTCFGDKLRARNLVNQQIEAFMACNTLNRFTQLGMPLAEIVN